MQDENRMKSEKKAHSSERKRTAWEQTLHLLDRRWYSERDLRGRLGRLAYDPDEIEAALQNCRRYGLVNDAALALEFAQSEAARGHGSRRIAAGLFRHGLSGEAAAHALQKVAPEEKISAQAALHAKLRSWSNEPDWRKRRDKAFRFLAGRGYPLEIVRSVIEAEAALQYQPMDVLEENFDSGCSDDFPPEYSISEE